jgi:beta-galactosidase
MIALNDGWEFTRQWSEDFASGRGSGETVRLPHTVAPTPQHYADPRDYQLISGYRRRIKKPDDCQGQRIFLQFDGAAHIATVYADGKELMSHRCGYTAFRVELTGALAEKEECLVAVRLDSTENPQVPPFGLRIDYLTYGGLYRPVWLDVRPQPDIEDIFVMTPSLKEAVVRLEATAAHLAKVVTIEQEDGTVVARWEGTADEAVLHVPQALPWQLEAPRLYRCTAVLKDNGARRSVRFGFRTAQFQADGFYLNGRRLFLRGLDRHQCYPIVGYAAPRRLQEEDARILKEELGCNIVRTSHYPQSQDFVNACDRLGLLVFTELPGWQHIGPAAWQRQAVENVEEMVRQYRNHPSVIVWGVRINESQDDDELYRQTNAAAHRLDPSRATTGVRYITNSHLLEDVYSFNDFSYDGHGPGCRKKAAVMKEADKALLITEANGHMFPTKSFDPAARRQAHALRHARVLNDVMADGDHAGCIQWCFFDYPTHQDFGSGDRVCYHGVCDAFRNPKLAAALYASQQDQTPVLEVSSSLDIGDYPAGRIGKFWVFTNADAVRLYKNDEFVRQFRPARSFAALDHPPVCIDDTIGGLLKQHEGFTGEKERLVREALLAAGEYGADHLPPAARVKLAWLLSRYRMSAADAAGLYGRYVANWGGEATVWRFDAVKDGKVVASRTVGPSSRLHLDVNVSSTALQEGETYDMALVRVRLLNEYGAVAHYAQLPVRFAAEGAVALATPAVMTAEGGMTGALVQTTGQPGTGRLTIAADGLEPAVVEFRVEAGSDEIDG